MQCAVMGGEEGTPLRGAVREDFLKEGMMRLNPELEKGSLVNRGREQPVPGWKVRSDQLGQRGQSGVGGGKWDWTGGRTTSRCLALVICCAVEVAFLLGPWWPPADSERGRDCLRGTLASVSGWNRKAKDRLGRGELGLSKGVAVGMGGGMDLRVIQGLRLAGVGVAG